MSKVLLIDGENFKKKIKAVFKVEGLDSPEWDKYDFGGLIEKVIDKIQFNRKIVYFGRIKIHPDRVEKSKELIEEQRKLKTHLENQGFEVVITGRVRGQKVEASWIVGGSRLIFKEKGVDVKIAVDMVSWACDSKVEQIVLGSSDSDLQPAIKEVRNRKVECIYLGFENLPNRGLTFTTNRTILIRNSEVLEFKEVK